MQLKTSSFNKGIYFFNLKRFWLIAFSFTFLLTLNIIDFLGFASENTWGRYATYAPNEIARAIFAHSDMTATLLFPFFSLVSALAVFSYIHFQRNTAMIHALPINRNSLFTTHYLSGLTLVLLPLAVSGVVLVVGELLMGITHVGYSLLWILVSAVILLLLYSFAVFAGMFTGHLAAHALFFLIFNFLAVFLEEVIGTVLSSLLFGYVRPYNSPVEPLSPIVYIENLFSGFSNAEGNYVLVTCYLLAGLAFTLGARAIYRRRHMETSSDVISLQIMKPVFKYSVAFCSSALLGDIIVSLMNFGRSFTVFVVSYLIGGLIGYYAAEMLLRKTFRVFKNNKGFIAFALIIVLLLSGVHFDFFGYETYVPDARDVEIMHVGSYRDEYVTVALDPESYSPEKHRYFFWDSDYIDNPPAKLDENMIRMLRLKAGVLEKPETIEKAVALHRTIAQNASSFSNMGEENGLYHYNESSGVRYFNLSITYRLKNGRIVERAYYLPYAGNSSVDLKTSLQELFTSDEYMEKANPMLLVEPEDLNFIHVLFYDESDTVLNLASTEELEGFLAAFKQDILNTDPLDLFLNYKEVNPTSIEITFSFKEDRAPVIQEGGITHITGNTRTIRLWFDYHHTLEYLAKKSAIDQALCQKMVDY